MDKPTSYCVLRAATLKILPDDVESRGISYDDWKEMKVKKLLIAKFLDQKLFDSVPATDKAIRDYYNFTSTSSRDPKRSA
jgi:hypothetical protein